jgi:hypothetical protein
MGELAVLLLTGCLEGCLALSIINGLKYIAFDKDAPSRQDHDALIIAIHPSHCNPSL